MIRDYYNLTKPGIIYGNAVTAIAGFLLASRGEINFRLFLVMLVGISLVIAAACVFNNVLDQDIDQHMTRTRNRAIVTGAISKTSAVIYGIILLGLGIYALYYHTNYLALSVALAGFVIYVFLYTPLKRRSIHATLVGAIAGAVPPVVGYAAVTNQLDLGAWLLFFILVIWQMPHFYAISVRRLDEYQEAHVPVLSVKKGVFVTKVNILVYIILFVVASSLLTIYHYTGFIYLAIVLVVGLYWLVLGIGGFRPGMDNKKWAKKMFLFSLIVLLVWSLMISVNYIK